MKKINALLSVFMIISIVLLGSGCMRNNSNGFVSYLNNKYSDDKFEFVTFEGGTLFGGDALRTARCTSETIPKCNIYVTFNADENEYSDNYLDMKYSNETDDSINNVFKNAFKNENFYFIAAKDAFCSTTKSSFLDKDISFNDYKQKRGIPIYAFVSNSSNKSNEQIVHDLEQEIIREGLYCDTIEIYVVDDYLESINTDSSVRNSIVVNGKYRDYLYATMMDSTGFDSIEWETE